MIIQNDKETHCFSKGIVRKELIARHFLKVLDTLKPIFLMDKSVFYRMSQRILWIFVHH